MTRKNAETLLTAQMMLAKYPHMSEDLKQTFRQIIAKAHALELIRESLVQRIAEEGSVYVPRQPIHR
jgi:hypothetical protein